MEVNVIKTDKDGNLSKEVQTITGVPESELKKEDTWREFKGFLIERNEQVINTKSGSQIKRVTFNDEQDERGTQLVLETFSPTDDAILSKLMEKKEKIHMFYEIKTDNYGTKFRIKAIQIPDGTWTAPKAKEAWRAGSAKNNRASALNIAAIMLAPEYATLKQADKDKVVGRMITIAEELYQWIIKE